MKENQNIEWKESWRDEYLKWICGFANASGGKLIIGKNDKGKVIGIENVKELLEVLPNKVRDLLGVMVDVNARKSAGKIFLEIVVKAYPNPINFKGEYYYRSGTTNQALKGQALDQFLLKKRGRHWDGVPEPGFTSKNCSAAALREALINAIVHKEYASAIPIQISVYDNKLMMWNPGQLLPNWSLDRLLGKHESQPANPDIANAFFRAGKIESWGRGIDLIRNTCIEQGYPAPSFSCDHNGLWIEFPFPDMPAKANDELGASSQKTRVKTPVKTPVKILQLLEANPSMTLSEVAATIGKSLSAVERASVKLVKAGRLKRIGPSKGGHWEVIK